MKVRYVSCTLGKASSTAYKTSNSFDFQTHLLVYVSLGLTTHCEVFFLSFIEVALVFQAFLLCLI